MVEIFRRIRKRIRVDRYRFPFEKAFFDGVYFPIEIVKRILSCLIQSASFVFDLLSVKFDIE